LLAGAVSDEPPHGNDAYGIVEVIKALQNDPLADQEMIFRVEWSYLPLLDSDQGTSPRVLESHLANDPKFYSEVIRTVFRSKKGVEKTEATVSEVTAETQKIAGNAYRLLSNWKMPPGSQPDGTFSDEVFSSWLAAVKAECSSSGHLEVAMTML